MAFHCTRLYNHRNASQQVCVCVCGKPYNNGFPTIQNDFNCLFVCNVWSQQRGAGKTVREHAKT